MEKTNLTLDHHPISNAFALVIVNKEFKNNGSLLSDRPGAERDRERSRSFCKEFGYTVNDTDYLQTDNLATGEIRALFTAISKKDFSSNDAFLCFISSHGGAGTIYGVDDCLIPVDKIHSYLEEVPSLVNKPKIFFIQNCRGKDFDTGVQVDFASADNVRHPKKADFLVSYASSNGCEAYRDPVDGSWFIEVLTNVLSEKASHMSLTDVLTIVNKKVAEKETKDKRKQMPCFTSSLRKVVYFNNRE